MTDNWKFFLVFLVFLYFIFCFCFFWGFKGQVRWPEGPTSLGPKPSLFIYFYWGGCFFLFFSLLFTTKNWFFPLEKGNVCLFLSLSLCFSFAVFWPPPFSISLSLSLSLSLSCFFFFFLLVFFLLSFGSFFLSLSFLLFLLCFCFMKGTTSKHLIAISFSSIFCFLVSCLFFLSTPYFLSLFFFFFPDFKLCILFNIIFWFQNKQLKNTHTFGVKRGLQQNRFFFVSTCVLQTVKELSFFCGALFWAIFGWSSKAL